MTESLNHGDDYERLRILYESVLHNSADGILVLDCENRILSWNAGAERIFGYTRAEVLGRSFNMFVPPDLQRQNELDAIAQRMERDGFLTNYETRRITKERREIVVNITSTLLRDPAGNVLGRSSIVRDVTEWKQMHEELLRTRSLAAVGEMAAQVAHEIRNPLAGISGAIQVIRDGMPEEDPRRAVIREMLAHVDRLDKTVRDMLMFARPWTADRRRCDVAAVLTQVIAAAKDDPAFAEIAFERPASAPGIEALLDPLLLKQLLMNLFQNASDAMARRGTITCRLDEDGRNVRLVVADNGSGVAPGVQAKLFRPFFTTKANGTGLGLAICKKIMDAHHGSIMMESSSGRGSELTLLFPRET
jgi:two-component system sporulation sensor kinase A